MEPNARVAQQEEWERQRDMPRTKKGMEAPDLMVWLERLRNDIEEVDNLEVGDLYDMMNVVVRLHHNGELMETKTLSKPGHMPVLEDFMHGCSEINLVKCAIIKKVNPRMMDVISAATLGRRVDDTNRLIGDDLSKMLKCVEDYHITTDEEERVIGHRSNPGCQTIRPCAFYNTPKGCRRGEECEYVHMEKD